MDNRYSMQSPFNALQESTDGTDRPESGPSGSDMMQRSHSGRRTTFDPMDPSNQVSANISDTVTGIQPESPWSPSKSLHIAHRKTPSELTSLMIEQINLQRQLDYVQQQRQQILAAQGYSGVSSHAAAGPAEPQSMANSSGAPFPPPGLAPPAGLAPNSGTGSTTVPPYKPPSQSRSTAAGGGSTSSTSSTYMAPTGSTGAFGQFSVLQPPTLSSEAGVSSSSMSGSPTRQPSGHSGTGSSGTGGSLGPPGSQSRSFGSFAGRSHRRAQSSIGRTQDMYEGSAGGSGAGGKSSGGNRNAAFGHSRRHSLGLNEAKRAAAIVQSQRSSASPIKAGSSNQPRISVTESAEESNSGGNLPPPSFQFPPRPAEGSTGSSGSTLAPPGTPPSRFSRSHTRSRSLNSSASPQRQFQFPARDSPSHGNQAQSSLQPNSYHNRQHTRNKSSYSRTGGPSAADLSTNWRQPNQNLAVGEASGSSNQLQPPSFVPGHRSRGSNSAQSISYSGQGGQQRKSLFAPYLPQASLPQLIAEGRLVAGTLRVNKKNRSDAYVATEGLLDADIFICGSKDRNRALEGDLVAVELLVVDEVWSSKREKEEKRRRKEAESGAEPEADDIRNDASVGTLGGSSSSQGSGPSSEGSIQRKGSLKLRPTQKKNDDVEVEGQSLLLAEEEEINDEYKPLYAGHVVAVIDRIPGQLFSGTLALVRPSQANNNNNNNNSANSGSSNANSGNSAGHNRPVTRPKIVWFKPTDKKVPLIAIPTEQAPADFVTCADKYSERIFVASIKRWPITSLHPFGTLIEEIGAIGRLRTELTAILRDNNFSCDEYPDEPIPFQNVLPAAINSDEEGEESKTDSPKIVVGIDRPKQQNDALIAEIADLPDEKTAASMAQEEVNQRIRRAFKADSEFGIMAVSPNDDKPDIAVHVRQLTAGKIELGVHIADVTSYVEPGSQIDKKVRKRSSTVLLAQEMIPMLPRKLAELAGFSENVLKRAISVVFELDQTSMEVEDVWIGESAVSVSEVITIENLNTKLEDAATSEKNSNLKLLEHIAIAFRKQRLGADVGLKSLALIDRIEDETVSLSLNLFWSRKAEVLLQELCVKTNATVAQKNYAVLGNKTLLRRQPIPTLTKLEAFARKLRNLRPELPDDIDCSTSASIQRGIYAIEDPVLRNCLETLFLKCVARGKYFVPGSVQKLAPGNVTEPEELLGHYTLALPLYTHSTAPLRRYADWVVHRQLKEVLRAASGEKLEEPVERPVSDETSGFAAIIGEDLDSLRMTAEYCTCKKDSAQNAQEQSVHLMMCQIINQMSAATGQLIVMATVLQVYESSFDVFIPAFGLEKRVHGDQLPVERAEFDKVGRRLDLYWQRGVDSALYVPEDEREPLSYRSSIKNNFRASSSVSAATQDETTKAEPFAGIRPEIVAKFHLEKMFAGSQTYKRPSRKRATVEETTNALSEQSLEDKPASDPLAPYLAEVETRVDEANGYYIQEVRELHRVPILLKAEIGMALPCLTVRALNPFVMLGKKRN